MKKFLYLLLILSSFIPESNSQNCTGDSVVIYHRHEVYGGLLITTDTFEIATGIQKNYQREISGSSSYVFNYYHSSYFIRTYIERNAQNDTTSYYEFQGTGTGYDNLFKKDITYDPVTNLITSRFTYQGSGSIWNLFSQEFWIYNSDNKLINYTTLRDNGSGTLENDKNVLYNYSGSKLDEIVYQTGQLSTWENSYRYLISYDASAVRDSIILENWDTNLVLWADSAKFNYDASNNYFAQIYWSKLYFDTVNNEYYSDTICLVLDTFNLARSYYSRLNHNQNIREDVYDYIRNHQVSIYQSTLGAGCFNESTNTFDTNGVVISYNSSSMCFMPQGHSGTYQYDSIYRPVTAHTDSYMGSGDYHYSHNYYYTVPDSISFRYLTMQELNFVACIDDSSNTAAIVLGGCGPYRFQWYPSTGLSSDTVKEPKIYINDTLTYLITVTDSLGNTASTTLFAAPSVIASLSVDSTTCVSCPFTLIADYYSPLGTINVTYQWYRNDSLIDGATQQNYSADINGIYRVEVTSPSPNPCTSSSLEFFVLNNQVQIFDVRTISIYPNPANEFIMVEGLPKNAVVKIFDLTGKDLSISTAWNSDDDDLKISINQLSTGFYFVVVDYSDYHSRIKLMVIQE